MDFINAKKQKTNQLYMQSINAYLDKMIPYVLEHGYQSKGIPNIKSVKCDDTPSVGIYDTLSYVYDSLMGFRSDLPIFKSEGEELVNFKLSVVDRIESMKEKMSIQRKNNTNNLSEGR